MPLKVTIAKGKGKVSCMMPGFHLDEKKRPFCFVDETTEQLDKMEKRGLVVISEGSDAEVEKLLKKASKRFTAKAKADKIAQLKREKETGGVSKTVHADGSSSTIVPSALTPAEVSVLADAEISAIEGNPGPLDELLGNITPEPEES